MRSRPWPLLRSALAGLVALALLAPPASAFDIPLRLGENRILSDLGDVTLEVFTYRPLNCARPSILIVFHGNGRDAESYRDSAKPLAEKACFVVYSPLFDEERFPSWSYHRGGVIRDGEVLSQDDRTVGTVGDLVDWIRRREGLDTPVFLFGHSAGGQFLSRVAAYDWPEGVTRIVIANPSTHVVPRRDWPAPYGFGALPGELSDDAVIRAYLAAPITVYLGLEDTGDHLLTSNEWADRQGATRLERGRYVFEMARAVASGNGWPFNWTLIETPGIAHSARGMLGAPEMIPALGFSAGG